MDKNFFINFPTTRYQGSKRKLLPWLHSNISSLDFRSALDVFGGTGSVSYLLKKMTKRVTFNDYLRSNYLTGKALIENDHIRLSETDIQYLLSRHQTISYQNFVQETFNGIFYTDEENTWIDMFLTNWNNLREIYKGDVLDYKKALAFYAFSQSALKKRPFNMFHRANLYLRLNNVKRSFGNKTSWEGSFENYFRDFSDIANKAVFSNKKRNIALNLRASDPVVGRYDLIYIDPPYVRDEASGANVDYLNFYHFLEGAIQIDNWRNLIDYDMSNLKIRDNLENEWIYKNKNRNAFEKLFETFANSIIVVSYKEPGIPSKRQLINSLKKVKRKVISIPAIEYNYALNKNNGYHREYLLIGVDN